MDEHIVSVADVVCLEAIEHSDDKSFEPSRKYCSSYTMIATHAKCIPVLSNRHKHIIGSFCNFYRKSRGFMLMNIPS